MSSPGFDDNSKKRLTSILLCNSGGGTVKTAYFDNSGTTGNGRVRLDKVTVKSGDVLLDSRSFKYHALPSGVGKDLFGYVKSATPNETGDPVLGIDGKLKTARIPSGSAAGLLYRIEDAMEAVTELEYEPSRWTGDGRASLLGSGTDNGITIGVRIKSITVTDHTTRRQEERSFSYSDPVLSADLTMSGSNAYTGLSGSVQPVKEGALLYVDRFSVTATRTSSSRLPGFPIENTTVWYRKVTENVSGTGISHPVRTVYEFDASTAVNRWSQCGSTWLPSGTVSHAITRESPYLVSTYPANIADMPEYRELFS